MRESDAETASQALEKLKKALKAQTGVLRQLLAGYDFRKSPTPEPSDIAADLKLVSAFARLSPEQRDALRLGIELPEHEQRLLLSLDDSGLGPAAGRT